MPARPARLTKIALSMLALLAVGTTGCENALTDPNPVTQPVVQPPAPDIVSNFDDNTAQGWTLRGNGSGPNVHPTLRQAGTHSIWANGRDNWFRAPRDYRGDLSAYYGAELSYFYLWSNPSGLPRPRDRNADIELTGANGLTFTLRHIDGPSFRVREWKYYSVRLDANAGWLRAHDGSPATRADIEDVLRNVTELAFRASRRASDVDNNYIDEVRLEPAPGAVQSAERP